MRPVWDEALDADTLGVLDPGPVSLDATPDVLVIGGGAVGLAAAVMCRRAGIDRVQVIERDRCIAGPSGSPASGLSPGVHSVSHPDFVALANASLALHRQLDAEWSGEQDLRTLDWLIVSPERIAPETAGWPGVEVIDDERAHAVEPELGGAGGALFIRDQAWVHPIKLAVAMARRAGSLATRCGMTGVVVRGGRIVSITTTAGPVAPGAVVFATGTALPDVITVPHLIVKGHLLATEPAPFRLRAAVASSIIVVPLPDGRLVAGGTFDVDDRGPEVRDDVIAGIRQTLARLLPKTEGIGITHAWCCFRPGTADGLPVIDEVPGIENAWLSVGHFRTGILLAPAAGRAVAEWIAAGSRPPGLDAFAVGRFA